MSYLRTFDMQSGTAGRAMLASERIAFTGVQVRREIWGARH